MKKRNIVGKNVKKIRAQKKLTQQELAIKLELLGIKLDRPMISRIENQQREVTDFEIKGIAKALEVNIIELFEGGNDK